MSLTLSSFVDSYDAHYGDKSRGAFTEAKILEFTNSEVRLLRVVYDLPTAEYIHQMPVWNDVEIYPAPRGYKGFISLQQNFYVSDESNFTFLLTNQFWADVSGRNIIADQWQGTVRNLLVRLRSPQLDNTSLNTLNSVSGNGMWKAFGDASNVQTNYQYYHNQTASVSFDLAYSSGSGGIYVDDMQSVDLSGVNIYKIGTLFDWSLFPSFTGWTSISFQWGSSATDYWEQTVTTPFGGTPFVPGWQQLGFNWVGAVQHGTPDASKTTFLRYTLNFPPTMPPQTTLCLDDAWMRQQILMNLTFTSEYLVTDDVGVLHEEFENFNSSSSWTLNVPPEFKDWIVFRVMSRAFTFVKPIVLNLNQLQSNLVTIGRELDTAYPSRRTLPVDNYYETVPENADPSSMMGSFSPWGGIDGINNPGNY